MKNAQAPRNKPHEVEEATGTLSITRKCFRHLALDYVLQVRAVVIHVRVSLFMCGSSASPDGDVRADRSVGGGGGMNHESG